MTTTASKASLTQRLVVLRVASWFVLAACVFGFAAWILHLQPKIGLPVDMGENIAFGQEMLRAWQGHQIDFNDDLPDFPYPSAYREWLQSQPHVYFPASTTLSAVVARIFPTVDPLQYPAVHFRLNVLLLVLLAAVMMAALGPILNRWFIVGTVVLLITLPRLFGEVVCNLKDFPQFVFASCFLCSYLRWRMRGGWGWLVLSSVLLGLGVATKPDTIFALAAVLLADLPWLSRCLRRDGVFPARQTILFVACLAVPAAATILIAYLPILTKLDENPIVFLAKGLTYAIAVNKNPSVGWNLHIPGYVAAATPPLFLCAMLAGLVLAVGEAKRSVLWRAMALYFIIIVFRSVIPGANPYGGLRQFLGFMLPASLFVMLLVGNVARWPMASSRLAARVAACGLFLLVGVGNAAAMRASAPYFTTYFSEAIGGLGGAQARAIPFACDNWNLSYAEAARWLDVNAPPSARIAVFEYPHLLRHFIRRGDIEVSKVESFAADGGDYLVTTRRKEWRLKQPTERNEPLAKSGDPGGLELVRQGGTVLSIVPSYK